MDNLISFCAVSEANDRCLVGMGRKGMKNNFYLSNFVHVCFNVDEAL